MAGVALVYPSELPGPSTAPWKPTDRRLSSDLPGPHELRTIERDKRATQGCTFLYTYAEAEIFRTWWRGPLARGGAWFLASWPAVHGGDAIRRFIGAPAWPQHIPGVGWQMSANFEIMGAALPPLDYSDPYWDQVILHLNGDDLSNFKRDWSPLNFTTGINGTPALNTDNPKYGPGCIDLRLGEIVVASDHVYSDALGADEFTLGWWTLVFGYPINGNDRIAFFGPFNLGIDSAGGGSLMTTEIDDLVGGGRSAYAPTAASGSYAVGVWTYSALTRTNDGLFAHMDLFVGSDLQTPSSPFPSVNPAGTTGFSWVGGGGGTNCLMDDFQLTRGVNRYRGLTSITPPLRLPVR